MSVILSVCTLLVVLAIMIKIPGPHMSTDLKGRDNDSGSPHLSPQMIDLDLLVPVMGHRYIG